MKANQIDAKKVHISAASLAPDRPVRKATPSDNTERTARSGAVVETLYLSRPHRAQCRVTAVSNSYSTKVQSFRGWRSNVLTFMMSGQLHSWDLFASTDDVNRDSLLLESRNCLSG